MKSPSHRGLQDIRTMTERISEADNPQRKYLSLAMLELEKARRNKEKQSAHQRVLNIDQRLADIAAEQVGLLAAASAELETSMLGQVRDRAAGSGPHCAGGGFTLSY